MYAGMRWRDESLPRNINWNRTELVLVTGDLPNTCGHILLYVGGPYFHFVGPSPFDYPKVIPSESEYQAFLTGGKKHELMRRRCSVPHPEKAAERLSQLLHNRWLTFVGNHNCASFAAQILHAGGNFYDMPSHCPVLDMGSFAFFERIFGPLRQKLGTQKLYESKHVR